MQTHKISFYRLSVCVLILLIPLLGFGQQQITGRVAEQLPQGKSEPITGATVYWSGTSASAITDAFGAFSIRQPDSTYLLVASFVGYLPDTLDVRNLKNGVAQFTLVQAATLKTVEVTGRRETISSRSIGQMQTITSRELTKAACCNLSESFETNASVEVMATDAATGAKQIQMLGLDGVYTQLTLENIPTLRGLSMPYRLLLVPGTWIEGIDIIKGTGSVVNGYESLTGQINIRLKEPNKAERLFVNQYVNSLGKFDTNVNLRQKVSDTWSGTLMLHTDQLHIANDRNHDTFLDQPKNTQYSAFTKWEYSGKNGVEGQYGLGFVSDKRDGGQLHNDEGAQQNLYKVHSNIQRAEAFSKTGYLFSGKPYQSIGLIVSGSLHAQDGLYGIRRYYGTQQTLYSNLIFQSILGNTNHSYKAGAGFSQDRYREVFTEVPTSDSAFARTENIAGIFAEYTYKNTEQFTVVTGGRADFNSLYGPVFTPRFNLKYLPYAGTTLRLTAGRGFRIPNPIAENTGSLVSSRRFVFPEKIKPEIAWNYGSSLTHKWLIGSKPVTFVADYYYTHFINQLVTDMYTSPHAVYFYNLKGRSYSHSAQAELQAELFTRFELKLAYKFYDVKSTYNGELEQRQFNSRHRVFLNTAYATLFEKWKFDFTTQWFGPKPVPASGLSGHQQEVSYAPAYIFFNAQITKAFKTWDVYLGAENLGNFRQQNPIIDAANPFGPNFDASMAWGPVVGRIVYAGIRYKIEK